MNTIVRPASRGYHGTIDRPRQSSAKYWGERLIALILLTWAASFLVGFRASLAVLTFIGFAAAILGLRRPSLGLFGIGILSTLDTPARFYLFTGGLLRWSTFNYWLLLVMLLSVPFLLRLRDPQTRLWQAFVLLLGLQLVITPDFARGVEDLLSIVTLLGLFVYFARNVEDKHIWYWLALVNATLAGAGGLSFFLDIDRLPYINPNLWAWFPLTGLFSVCLAFPFAADRWRGQLTLALLAAVNFVWVFLSGSRGSLLIAVFCLAFLILEMRSLSRRFAFLIVAFVLGLAVSTQFTDLQARVLGRIGVLLDPNLSYVIRTSGRSDLALAGWQLFLDNPFGVGTGGFATAWASLGNLGGSLSFSRIGGQASAHSGWIKILAENGIPGILLLVSYVLSFAIVGWRSSKQDRDLLVLGLLVTVILSVALISTEFQDKGLWFLAAGVTALLHREDIVVRQRALGQNEHPAVVRYGVSPRG